MVYAQGLSFTGAYELPACYLILIFGCWMLDTGF